MMEPVDPVLQELEGWPEWAYHRGSKIGPADGTPMVPTTVVGLVRLKKDKKVACQVRIEGQDGPETFFIYKEHVHHWNWHQVPRLALVSQDD